MEKNTIFAVVISIVVIFGFQYVQAKFFAPKPAEAVQGTTNTAEAPAAPQTLPPETGVVSARTEALSERIVTVETDLIKVELTNAGGDVISYKLKEHRDQDDFVEMVLPGLEESHAFTVAFGGVNALPVRDYFEVNQIDPVTVEFYQDFQLQASQGEAPAAVEAEGTSAPGQFRLIKRYAFKPAEYMFELTVSIEGDQSVEGLNFSGAAYTLGFGPQIGPNFVKLDQRYDYRQYYTYMNGKRKDEKLRENAQATIDTRVMWAAIAGKYFTFIAIPDATQYQLTFSTKPEPGIPSASRFYMSRPPTNVSRASDTYRFYLGPKDQKTLAAYDVGNNGFNLRNMDFSKAANTSGFLAPLEAGLKWCLVLFNGLTHNYGVAIILLTLVVRLIMFPLTKKGSEATMRMQAISPKIKEVQEKYKENPQLMNAKMAELYKQEGYNPLTGCFPMLIQLPIFFAMYNLFNNHFDLRGAMFIPGWIPDLSVPESIFNFSPFTLPFLGWSDIRLLPFIYVGSQLLSTKMTETPDQKNNAQMKMMLYVMPITFFFILYNVPSGLLLYWIMTNMLSLVQQVVINRLKKNALPASPTHTVIAPRKKKTR